MSMITRCPNCHTAFRITPAQLNAHEGQVRCGLCAQTFDGFSHLSSQTETETENTTTEIQHTPEPSIDVSASTDSPRKEPQLAEIPNLEKSEISWEDSILQTPKPSSNHPLLKMGVLVLFISLILQSIYLFRSYIAASYPQTRPTLVKLCKSLNCEIPLWRNPELLVIVSSDLQVDPAHTGIIVLTAVVRNDAAFIQDYPNLELTLTDVQSDIVARRIFRPHEYVNKSVDIKAGIAPRDEAAVKLFLDSSKLNATGYKLYLFYS